MQKNNYQVNIIHNEDYEENHEESLTDSSF